MQHTTPLTPGFMTRLAEQTAASIPSVDYFLYTIMMTTALTATVIFFLAVAGLVSVNPLSSSIFLISSAIALISTCLRNELPGFYESYSVYRQFTHVVPDETGMHGEHYPRFKHSDYSRALETSNPHIDRHLRPYDKLGFFNTHDDVEAFKKS